MSTVYNALREACGLSQADAEEFHGARLDSVTSWCTGRRSAPAGVITELQDLLRRIQQAGMVYAAAVLKKSSTNGRYLVSVPHESDLSRCGFPAAGVAMRVIALAIARLPDSARIEMVDATSGHYQPPNLPSSEQLDDEMRALAKGDGLIGVNPAPGGFQSVVTSQPRRPGRRPG